MQEHRPSPVESSGHNTSSLWGMKPVRVRITRWSPSTNGWTDFGGLDTISNRYRTGYYNGSCGNSSCPVCVAGSRNLVQEERNFSPFSDFTVGGNRRRFMHDPVAARQGQRRKLIDWMVSSPYPRVLLVLSHSPESFLTTKTGMSGLSRKIIAAIVDPEWFDGRSALSALSDGALLGSDGRNNRAAVNGVCPFSANPYSPSMTTSEAEEIFNFHVDPSNIYIPVPGDEPTLGELLSVAQRGRDSRVEFTIGSLRLQIRTRLLWDATKVSRWNTHVS
tara:strand:+ start:417 stop:1244 length:828 start_codon:yes stop_codon:yes gene_type:complete